MSLNEYTDETVYGNADGAHREHDLRGSLCGHTTQPLALSCSMLEMSLISAFLRACSYIQLIARFGAWLWRELVEVKAFVPRPHALTVTGSWLIQLHGRSVLFPRQY